MKEKITAVIDSDDYYELDLFQEDLQEALKEALEYFETCSASGTFIMTGIAGLWNGKHLYLPTVTTTEKFFSDIYHGDRMEYTFYEKKLEVNSYHHDGVNYYMLVPIESYTKKRLLNEYLSDSIDKGYFISDFKKPVSRATKTEIIEYIQLYYM